MRVETACTIDKRIPNDERRKKERERERAKRMHVGTGETEKECDNEMKSNDTQTKCLFNLNSMIRIGRNELNASTLTHANVNARMSTQELFFYNDCRCRLKSPRVVTKQIQLDHDGPRHTA